MSEQKLKEFGARAEELVTLPDFSELDRRGGVLRRRRIATVAALAACVLAVVVTVVRQDPPEAVQPIEPPDDPSIGGQLYPGNVMQTLDRGTYLLDPSRDDDHPRVRVTLPHGWNAWVGPNRFNGHAPGRSNEEALTHATWYAGLLVLDVEAVASRPCRSPETGDEIGDSADALVAAIRRIPGHRVTLNEKEAHDKFGYPATHLRLRETPALEKCRAAFDVFQTGNGVVGGGNDMWVVDVDGEAILVAGGADANTPPTVRRELQAVIDSIEFYFPEPPDGG